jgi:DNA-binding helix-hairpin-helix protein with protein kinase domain
MAMKMRQSLAELEEEFLYETQRDRSRQERLRKAAVRRSRVRAVQRERKRGSMRYWLLVLSMVLTALVVTAAMFASLYALLG